MSDNELAASAARAIRQARIQLPLRPLDSGQERRSRPLRITSCFQLFRRRDRFRGIDMDPSGCNERAQYDPSQQAGANPSIPQARDFFAPQMQVPKYVGWKNGATPKDHWTKSLLAGRDGRKLYVGVGSNSNVGENGLEVEYRRADVLEVDTATGASRIYAAGIRNPTGLQWEPNTGQLWAIANERDEIGPDLVPDYLTSVKENAFYGWPYSYYGQHVDPRAQPQRPDLVAKAIAQDRDGGLLIADDVGNTVWRVTGAGS
jgi:hypothetical protein